MKVVESSALAQTGHTLFNVGLRFAIFTVMEHDINVEGFKNYVN
jgi:hypothetical protein